MRDPKIGSDLHGNDKEQLTTYLIRQNMISWYQETPVQNPYSDWEQQQKHASFSQTTINSIGQSANAFLTFSLILVTLGAAMSKMSGMSEGDDWTAIFVCVFAWVGLTVPILRQFTSSARRVEARYLEEHATLFPHATAYRMESFLLRRRGD